VDSPIITLLATLALVLLVITTGGVVYLTAAEWRDRRRQKSSEPGRK
jgi:hypothetical protein